MRRGRSTLTLAFVLTALLVVVLPRVAKAAPRTPQTHAAAATANTTPTAGATPSAGATPTAGAAPTARATPAAVCRLPGLVRVNGSPCPGEGRFRRQLFGLPSPIHVVKKIAGGAAATAIKAVALHLIVGWVASGAESALKGTATVIDQTTSPELSSRWFSSSYWRIAGIAALLTLPFLCAAAIHALVRSDLGLLTRAAFGYLPLSLLAVGIASQLTMLLLSGTDEMSSIVASASAHADGAFLSRTSVEAIVTSVATGNPFVAFIAAIITVAAALALWVELLIRDAAVYVIVLMLPLFFAAMVWPARRALVIRAIETLIALILSKFAIVAVLALGGTALGHSSAPGPAAVLTGATLVLLAAFSPWALLRVLPLHEVASAAAGGLSQGATQAAGAAMGTTMTVAGGAGALGAGGAEWLRPRLLSDGLSSPLDASRFRDGRPSGASAPPGPDPTGHPGSRGAGGATGDASLPADSADGSAPGIPGDADPVTAAMAGGAPNGGMPASESDPVDASGAAGTSGDGTRAAGRSDTPGGKPAPAARERPAGPDGETFPFVLDPNDPPLVFSEELGALVDRGPIEAATDGPSRPSAPAGGDAPSAAGVEPPVAAEPPLLAEHDPVGPPAPPPPPEPKHASSDDPHGHGT